MMWRSCSGVPRGYVNRIRLWPLRRDDHSGVLIGAGGTRHSHWPVCTFVNDVSTRIDIMTVCMDRLIACAHGLAEVSTKLLQFTFVAWLAFQSFHKTNVTGVSEGDKI